MNGEDAGGFRRMLAAAYTLYGKDLTPQALDLWFESLKHYDLAAISGALSAHVRNPDNGQFLPRPADVVRNIEGGSDDAALLAWAKVDRALRVVGPYRTVVFDDPLIHYAVAAIGGWIKLGTLSDEDWKYQRIPFATIYRGARMRKVNYPGKLLGIAESDNGALHQEPPVYVGDFQKAMSVLASGQAGGSGFVRIGEMMVKGTTPAAITNRQGE